MIKQFILASLAIAAVAATSAKAQEPRSVRISIGGVDTHSERGARVILQRVKFAAGTVCGHTPIHLERYKEYDPCVREVIQRTVAGLQNPLLTAMLTNEAGGAPQDRLVRAD